jgi:cytochrome P450
MEKALPKYAYFPFGGGPRFCLGAGLALFETTLLLAMILREYSMEPIPDHAVEPEPGFTLRPRGGVRLVLRRRASV